MAKLKTQVLPINGNVFQWNRNSIYLNHCNIINENEICNSAIFKKMFHINNYKYVYLKTKALASITDAIYPTT